MSRNWRLETDANVSMTSNSTKGLICLFSIGLLFSNMFEAYFQQSFRLHLIATCTILFSLFFLQQFRIHKGVLIYVVLLSFYLANYYLFGPGDYRIVHVFTILIGVPLLYNVMVAANYSSQEIWGLCKLIWTIIYISLLAEFFLVVLGYQQSLYDIFQESINRPKGLPAYRSIHNTFAIFFGLDYNGLNSIVLGIQAYGQLCVTLTVFSFKLVGRRIMEFIKSSVFLILLPVLMYVNSPNVTGAIVLVAIIACNILVKQYIGIYSKPRTLVVISLVALLAAAIFTADFGFVRRYDWVDFYLEYVSPQIAYVLTRTLSESLIGVDLREFREIVDETEVGILSYASAVGIVFAFLNLALLLHFMRRNLKQIKALYVRKLCKVDHLEVQIKNLLIIVTMLVSSIHFPVLFDFVVSFIFILSVAFCLYSVNANTKILAGGARSCT